jgi:hypothetical protein
VFSGRLFSFTWLVFAKLIRKRSYMNTYGKDILDPCVEQERCCVLIGEETSEFETIYAVLDGEHREDSYDACWPVLIKISLDIYDHIDITRRYAYSDSAAHAFAMSLNISHNFIKLHDGCPGHFKLVMTCFWTTQCLSRTCELTQLRLVERGILSAVTLSAETHPEFLGKPIRLDTLFS